MTPKPSSEAIQVKHIRNGLGLKRMGSTLAREGSGNTAHSRDPNSFLGSSLPPELIIRYINSAVISPEKGHKLLALCVKILTQAECGETEMGCVELGCVELGCVELECGSFSL